MKTKISPLSRSPLKNTNTPKVPTSKRASKYFKNRKPNPPKKTIWDKWEEPDDFLDISCPKGDD